MEYNTKCSIMKTGKTNINPVYPKSPSLYETKKNQELDALTESSILFKQKEERNKERNRVINLNRNIDTDRLKVLENTYKLGLETIFSNIMFEAYYHSLYFDEEFKNSKAEALYDVLETYLQAKGGFNYLTENMKGSLFLEQIHEVCDKHAKKVAKRSAQALKERSDEKFTINFLMSDEEKDDLDKDIQDLNIDQLSKLVKDKVLDVLQDEKERVEQEDEFKEEIDNMENGEEIQKVKEQLHGPVLKQHTLWNALMQESYKEILKENANSANSRLTEGFKVDASSIDSFDGIEEENTNGETEVNMDNVMAEALTKYTLMELMYTIKLENYNSNDIQKISQQLVYK